MQMSYSYASHFRFENVCKIAQDAETIRNVWEKSNDGYSLSIRVQTTINPAYFDFYFFIFLRQYQRQRTEMFSFRARDEKDIVRHIDASSVVGI